MVWLAAMIILIVIEIVTVGLTTIWFAIGALAAVIVSSFCGNVFLQVTVFLMVSLGMLIFTRPLVVKYINTSRTKTNYEGIGLFCILAMYKTVSCFLTGRLQKRVNPAG